MLTLYLEHFSIKINTNFVYFKGGIQGGGGNQGGGSNPGFLNWMSQGGGSGGQGNQDGGQWSRPSNQDNKGFLKYD